jgi:hypothetical protein
MLSSIIVPTKVVIAEIVAIVPVPSELTETIATIIALTAATV